MSELNRLSQMEKVVEILGENVKLSGGLQSNSSKTSTVLIAMSEQIKDLTANINTLINIVENNQKRIKKLETKIREIRG